MPTNDDATSQQLLNEVIASYLHACDVGRPPVRADVLARYPTIASGLVAFFADQDRVLGVTETRLPETPATDTSEHVAGVIDSFDHPRRESFTVGSMLAGRYRIVGLTRGGMGQVYFADDLDIGELGVALRVAIKTVPTFADWTKMRTDRGQSTVALDYARHISRFRQEALRWTRLGMHPHIVWAMYVLDIGAKPYLVMEYADGGDLRERLQRGRLHVSKALNFALQFCEGMKHARHVENLIHRDIKPANVLIKETDILKISDFGLASTLVSEDSAGNPQWPIRGSDLSIAGGGTPGYAAPEQARSLGSATSRSDVFSFGAMLFEMLTGRRLFLDDGWRYFAADTVLPQALDLNPEVSAELSAVVARCLEFNAGSRFSSFDELASVLFPIAARVPEALPLPGDSAHARRMEVATPSMALIGEAYALISTGRYADAVACADRGITVAPQNAGHWINKSKALCELGQYSEARAAALEATRLNPRDAHAWANLGWAELMLGNPAVGLQAALRGIQVNGGWGDAWMCRSACEERLGRRADALRSGEEAARLDPTNWKAHANLAAQLLDGGRLLDAFRSLTRAAEINPRAADTWLRLAWIHAKVQSWREADRAVEFALQIDEDDARAWAMRAWVRWADGGAIGDIEASLRRANRIDPNNQHAAVVTRAVSETGAIRGRIGEPYIGTRESYACGPWTIVGGTLAKLEMVAHDLARAEDNFGAVTMSRATATASRIGIDTQLVCHGCRRAFSERIEADLEIGRERRLVPCECESQVELTIGTLNSGRHFLLATPFSTHEQFKTIAPEIAVRQIDPLRH